MCILQNHFNYQPTNALTYVSVKNTKTLKIALTCFDPLDHQQGAMFFLVKVILKTFTITETNEIVNVFSVTLTRKNLAP